MPGKKGLTRRDVNGRPSLLGIRSDWANPQTIRWYLLIGLSLLVSILLFPNILTPQAEYKIGDVADRDIKAAREFLVENKELTEKDRVEAARSVPPVYDFDPSGRDVISRVQEAFQQVREYLEEYGFQMPGPPTERTLEEEKAWDDPSQLQEDVKKHFFDILGLPYDEPLMSVFVKEGFPGEAEEVIVSLLGMLLSAGVVGNEALLRAHQARGIVLHDLVTGKETEVAALERFYDIETGRKAIQEEGQRLVQGFRSASLGQAALQLSQSLVTTNVTFNKRATSLREEDARQAVKPFYYKIKKGEMLIREGERVAPQHLVKLSAHKEYLKQEDMWGRVPAMALVLGMLFASMYVAGLFKGRSTGSETTHLLFFSSLLLFVFLVVMAFHYVAEDLSRGFAFFDSKALLFAVPVATGAMLIRIFHGVAVATSFSLAVSVLAAMMAEGRVEFFVYFFVGSLVAAFGVRRYRERGVFIKAGLRVSLCNLVLALGIQGLYGNLLAGETLMSAFSALIGGVLAGILATGILPLVEMSFRYTTDVKLLELANLDQPLLRDLMVQTPGTYHHSVIVSNMVEAAAQAIEANSLLAKVSAYYHDIGKMRKPLYFIENQRGQENRHEKLAPSMSSLILISHVKDGVELAKKYGLGQEIMDVIRQHHGTSLITFFYQKARTQAEKKGGKASSVKEEDFRYPGPKPQTKEAALVMLADVVEAASKTLADPTGARIQGMVQGIINKVFSDGQLDECDLTLKDLHEIARSFNKTLLGIFHHRIEYPEPVFKPLPGKQRTQGSAGKNGAQKKDEDGDTDQPPTQGSRSSAEEDKGDSGENLKRLGLAP